MRSALHLGLILLGLLGSLVLLLQFRHENVRLRGVVYDPPAPAADFSLVRADGTVFRLSEQRGKIVLLFFGYTFCPDVCPTTLSDVRLALDRLKEAERERVQVVFVSVDPGRDTPQRMEQYVAHFSPAFIGLSGSEETLTPIWKAYNVTRIVEKTTSVADYLVTHSAYLYLIDPEGYLRVIFPFGTAPYDIAHDIRYILSKSANK